MKRFAAALAVLLGAIAFGGIAGGSAPASAHAYVVDTDPIDGSVLAKSPHRLAVTFDETVRLPTKAAQLYDAKGKPLAVSARGKGARLTVDPPAELAAGTYVLVWSVVSADGHPVAGSLTFSVTRPSATVLDPPSGPRLESGSGLAEIHHGIEYGALLLTVGLSMFRRFLLPKHAVTADVARRLDRGILTSAIVAAVLSTTLAILGAGSWVSSAFIVLGLGVAVFGAIGAANGGAWRTGAVLGGAVLALTSETIVGHTRAAEPLAGVILVDLAHLAAGSVWFGGLVGLAVALPALARRGELAAETLARFSNWAAASLAVLVAAGLILTWRIVQTWDNLWHSPFGHLLLAKVALAAVAAAIAAVNRFALLPKARAALGHEDQRQANKPVRRAVIAEATLIVVVLIVTGFLVDRSPQVNQDVAGGGTGTQSALVGDYRVFATLAPSSVGANRLRVQVQDLSGEPVDLKIPPTVSVRSATVDLGTRSMISDDVGTRETTVILPVAGRWNVQVGLRTDEFTNPVTTLHFTVSG